MQGSDPKSPRNESRDLEARLAEKLREIDADLEAEPIPEGIDRLLGAPVDRPPPARAPGQRPIDYSEPCYLRAKPLLWA
jgi:tRNA(Ser,Leu) C12 N-acetylase TAN1